MRERTRAGAAAQTARRASTCVIAGLIICVLYWAFIVSPIAYAQTDHATETVVVRPAPDPVYNQIFDAIEKGVRAGAPTLRVSTITLTGNEGSAFLQAEIAGKSPDAVITLGRQANDSYRTSGVGAPQIIGGLDIPPGQSGAAGVSLTADPVFLLSRIHALMPEKRRIVVVFDPRKDRWLIDRARIVASSLDLSLVVYDAETLAEASTHYWNILKYGNPETDVLWLLSNPVFVSDSNLPRLVEESWRRNFAMISNNLEHARRGALIATYPDLEAMGGQLAGLARDVKENPKAAAEMQPLGAVKFALNKRIANHLGVSVSAQDERTFDLILGER